jgi:sigma-B regulation protein RsbU (phosphoserine phosphatase)
VESDIELDELVGKVGTLTRYAPIIKGLERELRNLQRLGEQLNRYFGEIDQEMRLAGRLQRDFLPRQMPSLASVGFEVFYRPASWVSGDMYDVFRIDEHHVGMFVADAMGHGVAAGLLTMFLRQALVSKHVSGSSYTIVSPAEALENLHQCLVRQQLPNSQFVTAAYGVVDTRTLEITIARAGHPYPVHIDGEGTMREVRSDGSLLGLADVPSSFEQRRVALAPGDKVLFYTDGVEEAVVVPDRGLENHAVFTGQMRHWAHLTTAEFVQAVGDYLDCRAGSLHPADDITMLLLEVWADAGEC